MVLRGASILVIEDEPDILLLLMILLEMEGAEVDGVGTSREALTRCREHRFDLVLTDLVLPDLSGDMLVREIRAAAGVHTPLVVITGQSEPFLTAARDAGADTVFTKPVEWDGVLTSLRDLGLPRAA